MRKLKVILKGAGTNSVQKFRFIKLKQMSSQKGRKTAQAFFSALSGNNISGIKPSWLVILTGVTLNLGRRRNTWEAEVDAMVSETCSQHLFLLDPAFLPTQSSGGLSYTAWLSSSWTMNIKTPAFPQVEQSRGEASLVSQDQNPTTWKKQALALAMVSKLKWVRLWEYFSSALLLVKYF